MVSFGTGLYHSSRPRFILLHWMGLFSIDITALHNRVISRLVDTKIRMPSNTVNLLVIPRFIRGIQKPIPFAFHIPGLPGQAG
jgi:hypothetical protein